jgi:hypothetical protein
MTLQWLLSWWNLLFIVPFALALMYLGLYTMSGITFGDADADGDFDADADGDFHVDADADADAHVDAPDHDVHMDADHDADGDSDSEGDSSPEHGFTTLALQWLGVGRVPVSIMLMVLLLTWGWIGFVCNVALSGAMGHGFAVALISVPTAFVGSLLITKGVVGLVARWLPTCETSARRRHELLGSVGEAIYNIDEKFGMTSVRDMLGELYQVPCKVGDGQPTVAKGERVKLVSYNARDGMFQVIPWERTILQ